MTFCKYKNALGAPNKGVHAYRLFNISIVDVLLTILLAYILSIVLKISFILTLVMSFTAGILLNRLFCVDTTIDKWLRKYV